VSADRQAEIRAGLELFHDPGEVIELRAFDSAGAVTYGYFDDLGQAAHACAALDGQAAVYHTLNVIDPALLARSANRMRRAGKRALATADHNVIRRHFLPVDFDAVRPAGISANDAEHDAAVRLARQCRAYLIGELGWPADGIVLADSGNGGHLDARIDLPNDPESLTLVAGCLEALAHRFDDDLVKIDQTVKNAARIWKTYGTLAMKGDSTPDRPHRRARVLEAPAAWATVTREQLAALAATAVQTPSTPKTASADGTGRKPSGFDTAGWLKAHDLDADGQMYEGGTRFKQHVCPFNAEHLDSAVVLELASGALAFRCQHNSCQGHDWHALRDLKEPDRLGKGAEAPAGTRSIELVSAPDLAARDFPEPRWAVPGLLPEGAVILAGPAKVGKSWFALEVAYAVAAGGAVLGCVGVAPGTALYLGLEDNLRRLKSRLEMIGDGATPPARLLLATTCPRLDDAGFTALDAMLGGIDGLRVVVIDTLVRVRPDRKRNGDLYAEDAALVARLQTLAFKHNICILIVTHTRKVLKTDSDALETVSGTMGLTGSADAVLVLRRGRFKATAVLAVMGRDIEERELALRFEPSTGWWTLVGDAGEVARTEGQTAIIEALRKTAGGLRISDLALVCGKNVGATKQLVLRMLDGAKIVRFGPGSYSLPTVPTVPHIPTVPTVPSVPSEEVRRGTVGGRRTVPLESADSSELIGGEGTVGTVGTVGAYVAPPEPF